MGKTTEPPLNEGSLKNIRILGGKLSEISVKNEDR